MGLKKMQLSCIFERIKKSPVGASDSSQGIYSLVNKISQNKVPEGRLIKISVVPPGLIIYYYILSGLKRPGYYQTPLPGLKILTKR